MKKITLSFILSLVSIAVFCQDKIDWDPGYLLNLADFNSPQSEISNSLTSYSITSGTNIEFGFLISI